MNQGEYTISVLTDDKPGLLNKLTGVFNRRKINIDSLNVSTSEVKGVSRYTIVSHAEYSVLMNVVKQIRKMVYVLGAFLYESQEIFFQEIALYKISHQVFKKNEAILDLIKRHDSKILEQNEDFVIIRKDGNKHETHDLYKELEQYGIMEFVRSGRVAISRKLRKTETYIKELESSKSNKLSIKDF